MTHANKTAVRLKDKFECSLCREILANPNELREHRLATHRDAGRIITYSSIGYFELKPFSFFGQLATLVDF